MPASFFFICLFLHVGWGLYYGSYTFTETWNMGIILLVTVIVTTLIGCVLPWDQISFWGAIVITNLSAIRYLWTGLVKWVWGGFSIDKAILSRFFAFHFILPFIISALVNVLLFFHKTGSNHPTGIASDRHLFYPYYTIKYILELLLLILTLFTLVLFSPDLLGDPDTTYTPANPLNTPPHIKPEWYFLFAYANLWSIPNKPETY